MTNAVCDSGPLTHLWQINQWRLFGVFDTLHIAEQVAQEVHGHVKLDQMKALAGCALHLHSVGVLLRAYKNGMLDDVSLDSAVDSLFVHSNLYLSPRFKSYVRRLIAEVLE